MIRALMKSFAQRPAPREPFAAAGFSLRHAGRSDVGRVRSHNEDHWFADPEWQLYLVTDGMGGQLAGDLASRVVVEVLPGSLRKAIGDVKDVDDSATITRVAETVKELSCRMCRESKGEPGLAGMGATLVMVLVRGAKAMVVHLGDSRHLGEQLRRDPAGTMSR